MKALLCALMLCSAELKVRTKVAWDWQPDATTRSVEYFEVCVNSKDCGRYAPIHRVVWVYIPKGPFLISVRACNAAGCSEPDTLSDVR